MPLNPCRISFPDRDLDEGDLGGTITWEAPKTLSKVLAMISNITSGWLIQGSLNDLVNSANVAGNLEGFFCLVVPCLGWQYNEPC